LILEEKSEMEIYGLGRVDSTHAVHGPHQTRAIEARQGVDGLQAMDQVDISPAAEMVGRVADLPEIRADRVTEIRAQIAAGVYETDAKLDVALGRLLDEIG
jgi:negative regulator of flagellin synthesis FlgM